MTVLLRRKTLVVRHSRALRTEQIISGRQKALPSVWDFLCTKQTRHSIGIFHVFRVSKSGRRTSRTRSLSIVQSATYSAMGFSSPDGSKAQSSTRPLPGFRSLRSHVSLTGLMSKSTLSIRGAISCFRFTTRSRDNTLLRWGRKPNGLLSAPQRSNYRTPTPSFDKGVDHDV